MTGAGRGPLRLAEQGYFFAGGRYEDAADGRILVDQMYVEFRIPENRTRAVPLVFLSGGAQSGLNYAGTPDGRPGWAEHFLRRGHAVYLCDQPARARSPWQPEMGALTRADTDKVQAVFTAPARYGQWPQARLHDQWPGTGVAGDPVFDQFFGQVYPSLADFPRQQALNRDAGVALLERIGPAVLITHSQSGTFGWLIADARPALVKAIVALEPSGPPVHDLVVKGAPDWFEDGPLTKPYGLTAQPLTYAPAVTAASPLAFAKAPPPGDADRATGWLQAEPARRLVGLADIPVCVVEAQASYHAVYDHCTVAFLRQAGVGVDHLRLADHGITGNGHMFMLELNSDAIAALVARWIEDAVG